MEYLVLDRYRLFFSLRTPEAKRSILSVILPVSLKVMRSVSSSLTVIFKYL
jgi:hypothetical protein